ncbi:MAG: YncE family protein [Rhizomicrobium sp.]
MRLRIAAALAFLATSALAGPSGYQLVKTVQLGGDTFWDCITFDAAHHRVFIAHGSHVAVVDTALYQAVGDIPDTPGVHDVAVTPGMGFVTAGGRNAVVTFDPDTLKTTGSIPVGTRPDGILYDAASRRVFTFNAGSKDSTVLDGATGAVLGTIALGGKPEFAVADGKGHIYDNIEDTSELVEIDARAMTVMHRWPLAPCVSPSGLAIDTAHARLFVACENAMMAAVNAKTGQVVATVPTGKGADGAGFDPASGDVLIPCGEDHLSVIREETPDRYSLIENVPTQFGARTMAFDSATRRLFTVTADLTPDPGKHPPYKMAPGSFRLLVYGR